MNNSAFDLSVVIASGAGGEFLSHCLDSLRGQVDRDKVEVIVVDRCGEEIQTRIEKTYSFVTLIRADLDHRPSVPELRGIGVNSAKGRIVAIIEEHCVVPSHWIKTILSSFQEDDVAIGGPIIDSSFKRLRDWVVYFSEYHNYLPPWPDEERYLLNGANIAYDHQKIIKYEKLLSSGFWEVVLHPHLIKEGKFRSVPSMGIYHTGPFGYGYYLEQRYLLSRVWGSTQRENVGLSRRLIYFVLAPVLPLFLLARIAHRVLKSRHHILKYFLAIPLLIPVVIAYVWGEWKGYFFGIGNALERVE